LGQFVIPEDFWSVRYNGSRIPGQDADLSRGANCQLFAYQLLARNGLAVPAFRSSELWTDTVHTERVARLEPLDLLLFNRESEAYGAHVAVWLGDDQALHLAKEAGVPEIWRLARFAAEPRYRVFIGAKRVRDARGEGVTPAAAPPLARSR
jgi:hypothetical protein